MMCPVLAPKGRYIPAQGKRSAALGLVEKITKPCKGVTRHAGLDLCAALRLMPDGTAHDWVAGKLRIIRMIFE